MKRLKLAVIGGGHLGRIHARLARSIEQIDLIGIVDPDPHARQQAQRDCRTAAFAHHRQIAGQIDAAVVAVPTIHHHAVGRELLEQGIHLLVEKPLASSLTQALQLTDAARRQGVVLQVGHVERFNPALSTALPFIKSPKYIEATRTSGFTFRSTDIGVVLDLMIHDLDVIISLVGSDLVSVEALGVSVFGDHEDMAQARLVFDNGCVAQLTASRCSFQAQRTMQLFSWRGYVGIDFGSHDVRMVRPSDVLLNRQFDVSTLAAPEKERLREHLFRDLLPMEQLVVEQRNAIQDELHDFVAAIQQSRPPRVTGQQACQAIEIAERVLAQVAAHQWNGMGHGPSGPLLMPEPALVRNPLWPLTPLPTPQRKAG